MLRGGTFSKMRYRFKRFIADIFRHVGVSSEESYGAGYPPPMITPEMPEAPARPRAFEYNCWECGAKITQGTNFCPKCGCDVTIDGGDNAPYAKTDLSDANAPRSPRDEGEEARFCTKCGKRLPHGAKFCGKCGTATQESDSPQRKADGESGVQKCPSCGRPLTSFTTHCPACDYEIRGTGATGAVCEFYDRFTKASTLQMRMSVIRNFPVPNTKEDITEFMVLACSNFDALYYAAHLEEEDVSDAWLAKIEQCYQKAKIAINNEADFYKIQQIYEEIQAKIAKARHKAHRGVGAEILIRSSGFLFGLVFFLISVLTERAGGFGGLWDLLGAVFLIVSGSLLGRKSTRPQEYVFAVVSIVLSFVFASFLENGVILVLAASVLIILVSIFFFKSLAKKK